MVLLTGMGFCVVLFVSARWLRFLFYRYDTIFAYF